MELLKVGNVDLVLGAGEYGALQLPVVPVTALLAAHGEVAGGTEKVSKYLRLKEKSVPAQGNHCFL